MRLRPERVQHLTDKIFAVLAGDPECQFVRDEQLVKETIREIFLNDLRREDQVEAEIWQKLDANREQIDNRQVDRQELFRRAKQSIARSRGLIF